MLPPLVVAQKLTKETGCALFDNIYIYIYIAGANPAGNKSESSVERKKYEGRLKRKPHDAMMYPLETRGSQAKVCSAAATPRLPSRY